ncbi:MAG: DUF4129 domain-containing protein [Armatimonadetes bacterium]|nr:DUF4129 domain-containing protein [Armatimonadota bacterium]
MIRLVFLVLLLVFVMAAGVASSAPVHQGGAANPTIVHRELTNIFAAPEYNRFSGKPAPPNIWEKLLKKLGKLITRLFEWMSKSLTLHGGSAGRIASFIFACVIIIAFLALLALIISRLAAGRAFSVFEADERNTGGYDLPSARPLMNEAAKLAEAGDYKSAYRCAYLASISFLDETNALRFERSRTNWEYLRELKHGGHEEPYDALRPLTLDFDRKFYGHEDCRREDYLNAVTVYNLIAGEASA